MRRILSATIWAPDALPLVQHRFKPIFRILLPVVDALLILFGLFGLILGSKVVETYTLHWYNPFWASAMGLSALAALGGLVFERNWVEVTAKVILLVSTLVYAFILGVNVQAGAYNSTLTITLALVVSTILLGRIFDLVGEIARKELRGSE